MNYQTKKTAQYDWYGVVVASFVIIAAIIILSLSTDLATTETPSQPQSIESDIDQMLDMKECLVLMAVSKSLIVVGERSASNHVIKIAERRKCLTAEESSYGPKYQDSPTQNI